MVEFEDGLTDYNVYVMSNQERILNIILAAVVLYGIGFVFYKHHLWALALASFAFFYPKVRIKQIIYQRKRDLNLQFKDMLYSLSASLSAGKSLESAFKETLIDLSIIYPNPDTYILQELSYLVRRIEINDPVENVLQQFADRAHLEDLQNLCDIFITCKRTGGDLTQVIRSTSQMIGEKIEIGQEIETIISGKRFEFKALMVMPVVLILLLTYTAPDYMNFVFNDIAGRIVMTLALVLFAIAYFIGHKIMKIEV